MIYKDGKFISVLTEIETEELYAELPRNKKKAQQAKRKRGRPKKNPS